MRMFILILVLVGCESNKFCYTPGPYKVGQQVVIGSGSVYGGCKGYITGPADSYIPMTEECKARYYVTTTECNGTNMSEKLIIYFDGLNLR